MTEPIEQPEQPVPFDPDTLKARLRKFAELYIVNLDASKSAREAGYSAKSAGTIGYQLITDPRYSRVQQYIAQLKKERAERVQMDADYILHKLKVINEAKIEDYVTIKEVNVKKTTRSGKATIEYKEQKLVWKTFDELTEDQKGAIQSMKQGSRGIEIKLFDKSWSLDMAAKHIGFFEKDNKQKNQEGGVAIYLPDNGREKEDQPAADDQPK
jgi:phage terminase small subunit